MPLVAGALSLRPWTPADGPELDRIAALPEVARWWGPEDFSAPPEEDTQRYTIRLAERVCGMIQFYEESDPAYRHAGIDIFVDPAVRGRQIGVAAIVTLARWLCEARGHHRLIIDPALDNAAAVRAYEKAGFSRVGVLRRYWRDPVADRWRDGLLMDMLAEEIPPTPRVTP
ncbi:GNAT family N-acetyltransferase [Salinactinospora qingdaonensis]|uniref:GNAT family N-acetyltransferase n=1 Tax=Salinactinospora qingdaonensis TaxID=702744 RepID=UPI003CD060B3